ncbi:hypothetical protein FQA39_LY07792 [Lamprigera yunnana]|nr:hypothetical protein FQA39_LY07792 [Lamprigera yunnana]
MSLKISNPHVKMLNFLFWFKEIISELEDKPSIKKLLVVILLLPFFAVIYMFRSCKSLYEYWDSMSDRSIDSIIDHLLWCGTHPKFRFDLTESEIKSLCVQSINVLLSEPMLLEIDEPVAICGDIHGYFYELTKIFNCGGFPPCTNYLFLGDYIDRGEHSLEVMCLLLAYKIKHPRNFFLLRGNHECRQINRDYGFYKECVSRYSVGVWKAFNNCFDCFPVAAVVFKKIFCCHGGLSPDLHDLEQILLLPRPTNVPSSGLLCDLLWSDPCERKKGWSASRRGISFVFGEDVVQDFLQRHNMELICRAHEVAQEGYRFFADKKLVTIFSVPGYCGGNNKGAIMFVDQYLECDFKLLK